MLCLTVPSGGHLKIGDTIVYLSIEGNKIKARIDGPKEVPVVRSDAKKRAA